MFVLNIEFPFFVFVVTAEPMYGSLIVEGKGRPIRIKVYFAFSLQVVIVSRSPRDTQVGRETFISPRETGFLCRGVPVNQ